MPAFLAEEKKKLEDKVAALKASRAAAMPRPIEAAEKAVKDFPADPGQGQGSWTKDKRRRRQGRAGQGPRRALPCRRQDAGGDGEDPRHRQEELPGADPVPDGRYRRAAAHPDALLHDAVGQGGAPLGVLVAVLHLPALLHRAGAGHPGQVRGLSATWSARASRSCQPGCRTGRRWTRR